ncbi:MAG: chromosome segregation protein SMC [Clostridiales bacterium]|nr:chromosome segregation protein SMC [Clostridiales bacterium]
MILKSLEMQGFKSFPDKTTLEFDKGMTAVIGPNGSGKSNISDAVRWVLGEKSTKSLRGAKMDDVIFSGTDTRKKQGFAEVTLKLDNSDHSLKRDEKEVSVTRRYYRSGESEYLINGATVRLKDLYELFMDTGLGKDGYSLVSQGKIADMISSKSNERRDMFDEAAGISHFRYRRADATRRLEQAEENLVRLRDILQELESRVGPLKVQSEKAQKFLVLAEEKKELEIGLWLNTINKTKASLREQEHKIETARNQYKEAEDSEGEIEKKLEEIEANIQSLTGQIDEIRRGTSEVEEQATRLEGEIAVNETSILHNNETIERINKDKEIQSDTNQHLDEQIEKASFEIKAIEKEIELKKTELDRASVGMDDIVGKNEELDKKQSALNEKINALNLKISDHRVEYSTVNSSIEEINARVETINNILSSREETLNDLREKKTQAKKALEETEELVSQLSNALSGYSLRLQSRKEKAEKLQKEQSDFSREVAQKNDKIRILEDLEKNMEGYSGSVKVVMREAGRGTLRGIHGPISQLITVKEKYSVAVETALGAAIQNVVTDSENDAKRAINYLKENKGGRATFLPITAIKGKELNESGLDDCDGYIDIAANLVACDEKYKQIIKSQLGRTAVVEDIDCAIAIAKKYSNRFRIVTLDGQIINAGGSMTGGSRAQNVGILSRSNEIDKLKNQVEADSQKLKIISESYKAAVEALSAVQADLDGTQADLTRAQEDKIRRESDLTLISGQLETALGSLDELIEEKETSSARLEKLEVSATKAQGNIDTLTAQLQELEAESVDLATSRDTLNAQRDELNSDCAKINMNIVEFQKDISAKNELIESLNRRKSGHNDRLAELDDEIEQYKKKNIQLNENIENIKLSIKELREKAESSKGDIEKIIEQRTQFESKISKLRMEERNKSAEREKLSVELARLEERKNAMAEDNEAAVKKLYDEYELTVYAAEQVAVEIEDVSKAQRRLNELKSSIRDLGSVNVAAIEEYKEVGERYEFMKGQIEDVETSRDELNKLIEDLTSQMSQRFTEQFNNINHLFGQTFVELFGGGKASLELDDPSNVLECAININVQPPGKTIQNIDLLSGGEKGLSAIALLFSMMKVSPTPFCIFDEVEAALDDVNVNRYAQYVRRMTDNTQFILITHRRGTMEEADVLYGVTMQEEGVSKVLKLETSELANQLGIK